MRCAAELLAFHWKGSVLFEQLDLLGTQLLKISGFPSSTLIQSSALHLLKLKLKALKDLKALISSFLS